MVPYDMETLCLVLENGRARASWCPIVRSSYSYELSSAERTFSREGARETFLIIKDRGKLFLTSKHALVKIPLPVFYSDFRIHSIGYQPTGISKTQQNQQKNRFFDSKQSASENRSELLDRKDE